MVSHCKPKSPSLTYCIMCDSLVRSKHIAVLIYEITLQNPDSRSSLNVRRIIIVGNKTYLLTVRLIRHQQSYIRGNLSYLRLGVVPARHQRMCKLFLREIVERGYGISSAGKPYYPCIVSRRHIVSAY